MSQITLRQIPQHLEQKIRAMAQESGRSLNRTIVDLLESCLGLRKEKGRRRDLRSLAGDWTQADVDEFERNTACLEETDEEVWRT